MKLKLLKYLNRLIFQSVKHSLTTLHLRIQVTATAVLSRLYQGSTRTPNGYKSLMKSSDIISYQDGRGLGQVARYLSIRLERTNISLMLLTQYSLSP